MAWSSCTPVDDLYGIQYALQAHLLYSIRRVRLEVIGSHKQLYTSQFQRMCHTLGLHFLALQASERRDVAD